MGLHRIVLMHQLIKVYLSILFLLFLLLSFQEFGSEELSSIADKVVTEVSKCV